MTILIAFFILLAIALTCGLLARRFIGFQSQRISDYANAPGQELDIRKNLAGEILCEGVLYGPTGRVTARFVADMAGKWDGNVGQLVEKFSYDSGTKQRREWQLTLHEDGVITAEAEDLQGTGRGQQNGSTTVLNYRIKLPKEAGGHVLDVTDWMYLVENGTIINRSQFRKYGIKVAELVATMRPKE